MKGCDRSGEQSNENEKMADLVERLFQKNINQVEGGEEVLQKLRNNRNEYDITGIKAYTAAEGRSRGLIAGVRDHGFIDAKPFSEVGLSLIHI